MSRMMQQYHDAKAAHPGMIVLFRNGDFYELFEEDAELGSRVLNIQLTKRDGVVPMAGVPVHKLEHYLGVRHLIQYEELIRRIEGQGSGA